MMKANTPPKAHLVIKINLFFLASSLVIYATLLLRPSTSAYHENAANLVRCSLRGCHHKVAEKGFKMKAVLEEANIGNSSSSKIIERKAVKRERPSFLDWIINNGSRVGMGTMKIGVINMEGEDLSEWNVHGHSQTIPISFKRVSDLFEWSDLFPEWIDEEEEMQGASCPEIPMPDNIDLEGSGEYMEVIVAKVPCGPSSRDVFRLQVHLIAAKMAVRMSREWKMRRRRPTTTIKVVLLSKCRPMLELFRCEDLVRQEGDWWYYEPDVKRLQHKVSLPVGSCNLALPLWGQGIHEIYDVSKLQAITKTNGASKQREAYATVLHSSESYVCGAIALAQSLLRTGTTHDLVLLIDNSISTAKREVLAAAGWKLRIIKRIRNPRAEKDSYNEYNYSKLRLWQLTDYDKIIFIDSDIIVLRNLDILFRFPQMSAVGNDNSIFNSGIMVIEPSNCTFNILMERTNDIVSYNGGDQGFLNEIFVWWHRLPRRVNFLKNFWSNTTVETSVKNQLFGSDPPKLYAIHYLGLKPWSCYRDYDCNWDIVEQRVYASDVAHRRWWEFYDGMAERLQRECGLPEQRKIELKWERRKAKKMGLADEHWKINVTDPRRLNK